MPTTDDKLVVAVSSRALFDLETENALFEREGVWPYRRHQVQHETEALAPGWGFPFIARLLRLNHLLPDYRPVEVILLSKNDPDTGLRVLKSIEQNRLEIVRSAFTGGGDPMKYLKPFGVSLFLSADYRDVKSALAAGFAAGCLLKRAAPPPEDDDPALRLAFDFDGVLAGDEAERVYAEGGLTRFVEHEHRHADDILPPGPLQRFMSMLSQIQRREQAAPRPPDVPSAIRTAVVTARGAPAHQRAIKTLRAWGIRVDEALFLGGMKKDAFLAEFRPHIFFDDQLTHLESELPRTAAVHIPYGIRNPA